MQVTGMKDKVDFQYKNSFDAIRTIVRSEGLRGLYTGLSESKKTSSCPSWATDTDFCSFILKASICSRCHPPWLFHSCHSECTGDLNFQPNK